MAVEDIDNEINDIVLAEDNSGIYLGSKNYTKHLGQDFLEIYHYEYPAGYYFKSGLGDYKQDLFFIQLHNEEDKPEIWHNVLPVQELEHAEEYLLAEDEAIKLIFSDTDLILGGTFELVKPTCVIKSFPWFDVAEYDYCDLSLDEFEIYHTSKDTAWTYINYAGELIVVYDYFYEYHYKVSNLGDGAINQFNVYSSNFTNIFENKLFLSEEITDGIAPGETREFIGEYETSFALSLAEQAYSFYIPGGDFLKDEDMSNNVQVETIISNVDDFVYEGIEFSIYPNPASSLLNVITDESNIVSLSLYSLTGEIIYRSLKEGTSELDISDFNEGMYFIELISETGKRGLKPFMIKR